MFPFGSPHLKRTPPNYVNLTPTHPQTGEVRGCHRLTSGCSLLPLPGIFFLRIRLSPPSRRTRNRPLPYCVLWSFFSALLVWSFGSVLVTVMVSPSLGRVPPPPVHLRKRRCLVACPTPREDGGLIVIAFMVPPPSVPFLFSYESLLGFFSLTPLLEMAQWYLNTIKVTFIFYLHLLRVFTA